MSGTLYEDQCRFLIISLSVLLGMRNISDKSCRENQGTHFYVKELFFSSEYCALCEILWKNIVQSDRPQRTL